jgi:GTPase
MSRQIIGFAEDGRIVNHDSFLTEWADIVKESNKLIMFIDLAGNKRYFKTTLFGLTSQLPDYALIAIAADQGISDTTKEHLRVIVALDIPCFVILTRSDLATPEQIESTKSIVI